MGWGALLVAAGAVGCASPSVPKPPSLKLPETVKNLSANRVVDQVTLRWTTPTETTDHLKLKGTMTAVICREQPSRRRGPGTCAPVDRKVVLPGAAVEALETLPPELTSGNPRSLAYRVELKNENGRSAGLSEPAWTASGNTPGVVSRLAVASRRAGALVTWQAQKDDESWVEVSRLRLDLPAGKSAAAIVLRGGEGDGKVPDQGGLVDTGAEREAHYRYTAQRVRLVTVGGRAVEIRGPESPEVSFSLREMSAPRVPQGLVAVPSEGSIDLSWDAGDQPDLAGYNVYRTGPDGAQTKLTTEPVAGPAFRDTTAAAGTEYEYRVTALDANGNESARSGAVKETGR